MKRQSRRALAALSLAMVLLWLAPAAIASDGPGPLWEGLWSRLASTFTGLWAEIPEKIGEVKAEDEPETEQGPAGDPLGLGEETEGEGDPGDGGGSGGEGGSFAKNPD